MTVPAGTGALEATQQSVLSQLQSGINVSVTGNTVADTVATGTITAAQPTAGTVVAGGTVSITLGTGQGTWEAQLTGTFSSGTTIVFEGTDDTGTTTNWFATVGYNTTLTNPPNITSVGGPGPFVVRGSASGYQQIRMRASALTVSDSIAVRLIGSNAPLGLGGLSTNDGSFAKETGGNLASIKSDADSIVTNTTGLATQSTLSAAKTDLDSILTHEANIDTATAASKTDLDTIVTQTATPNISDRWARQVGQVDIARVLGSALSYSNPLLIQDFLRAAIIAGIGFGASFAQQTSASSISVGYSIWNAGTNTKTIYLYSLRVGQQSSSYTSIYLTTANPALTTSVTPASTKAGSGNASIATVTYQNTTTSSSGTFLSIGLAPGSALTELLSNGDIITLPPGNGLLLLIPTSSSTWSVYGKWVEI